MTIAHKSPEATIDVKLLTGHDLELLLAARVEDPEFTRTSGKTHHSILRPAGSDTAQVEGTALEVTEAELERTGKYEPVEYKRVVASLASGRQVWVYVDARVID